MRPVPKYISDFILRIGGRNRHGSPNYRVVWGPDRLETSGGAWVDENGTHVETRQVQKYGPEFVWHLEKWCPPEMYGDSENWEYENALRLDGLTPEMDVQLIGGFPFCGEYEHSFKLSPRLYLYTLEKLIRLNMLSRFDETTPKQRQEMRQAAEDKKKQEWKQMVIDLYKDRAPAYYGPVSFAGQKNHTALMDRLDVVIKQLERGISGEAMKKALGLGFTKAK